VQKGGKSCYHRNRQWQVPLRQSPGATGQRDKHDYEAAAFWHVQPLLMDWWAPRDRQVYALTAKMRAEDGANMNL